MKPISLILGLFCLGLFGCSSAPPSPPVEVLQTSPAPLVPTIPKFTPDDSFLESIPTSTPEPSRTPTPEPISDEINIATVIADDGPHFSYAEISGVAHMENGYFLITIEVPGGLSGEYYAMLGEESFDCMVLEQYPDRLYCTGLTSQAGAFADLQVFGRETDQLVFEVELGIPPVLPLDSIQARIKREERERSPEFPPADSPPYPYPYP